MPDYAKMYRELFNALTDAVELLQTAQQKTEEMYLSADEPPIEIARPSEGVDKKQT